MPPADPPRWSVLFLPKQGNAANEYEDAWAADPNRGRFAVADGASETSFAGLWAQLLAQDFVAAARPPVLTEWLPAPRRRWSEEVMGLELPWYAEMKREEGAFAALVGLGLRPPRPGRPGRWRAVAVGDSCVIHVRGDGQFLSFPMQKADEFDNRPRLLGSRNGPIHKPDHASHPLAAEDRLYLMTDALAQWFLHAHEEGDRPWEAVASVLSEAEPEAAFAAWIAELRDGDALRNDDVTVLAIDFPAPAPKE